MDRLLKLKRRIKALPRIVMSKRVKVSDSHAFVIAKASARDIDWCFADNVAERKLKKSRHV